MKIPEKKRRRPNRENESHILHSAAFHFCALSYFHSVRCKSYFPRLHLHFTVNGMIFPIFFLWLFAIVLARSRFHINLVQIFHIWCRCLMKNTPIQPRYISLTLINARCLVCKRCRYTTCNIHFWCGGESECVSEGPCECVSVYQISFFSEIINICIWDFDFPLFIRVASASSFSSSFCFA